MTHEISPEFEALLQLAATVRKDHEEAKARSRGSDSFTYPANLRGYVAQVKALVGDWEEIWADDACTKVGAAQTYYAPVKLVMQKWMTRAQTLFPERLSLNEAAQTFAAEPKLDEEAQDIAHELGIFLNELLATSDLLKLRLLAIKYDLQFNS
jgi:hypothetical protein